jgi:hypothetical protein
MDILKSNLTKVILLGFGAMALHSCEKEAKDPPILNEEELITTVQYTLISTDLSDTAVFEFKDLDGDGGNAPEITSDSLNLSLDYNGTIHFLDESGTEVDTITNEVFEEAVEHQVFYSYSPAIVTTSYEDMDPDSNPIGIETTVSTESVGSTTLTITLRHQPDKSASGVKDGVIDNAGGETDVEVNFDLKVY